MRLIPLQSGSAGNCCLVESGTLRVLIDAGISARRVKDRLGAHGIDPRTIAAIFITHEHGDHVGAAGALARAFGLPVHITERTFRHAPRAFRDGDPVRTFRRGETVTLADAGGCLRIESIPVPHDASDGSCFIVDDGRHRLGVMTDFGHVHDRLGEALASCDAALLEANYDERMLRDGPYPWHLKRRISGPGGHISNADAGALLARWGGRLQWACLGHLSETNNTPELAMATVRAVVDDALTLHLAPRRAPAAPMTVSGERGVAEVAPHAPVAPQQQTIAFG